jgi:hypothetical protein
MKIGGVDGHGDDVSGYQNSRGGASGRGGRCVVGEADWVGLSSLADCLWKK